MNAAERSQALAKSAKRKRIINNLKGWAFSVWPFVGFCLFALIPFIFSFVLSFSELHSFDITEFTFVGFKNYGYLLSHNEFWWSLLQTFVYWLSVPINLVIGLLLAVLLHQDVKGKKIIRVIYFIPNVCSVVCVGFMWRYIFHAGFGVLNGILQDMHFITENVSWLTTGWLFMPVVIFTTTWGAGAGSILFQAALEQVNQSCIEAAELDGAGRFKVFFHVTLPSISPTLFYVVIMNTIGALQAMVNIDLLTSIDNPPLLNGNDASMVAILRIYRMAFQDRYPFNYGMGMASAFSWLLTIVIGLVTFGFFKIGNKLVSYDN